MLLDFGLWAMNGECIDGAFLKVSEALLLMFSGSSMTVHFQGSRTAQDGDKVCQQ